MPRPGPSVTSGADLQPGSDSLFPSGFGGGATVGPSRVGTTEIADGSIAAADLNLSSVAASVLTVLPAVSSYTYNADGTVATETVAGVTTSYTYNADGTVATMARSGVTRTFSYNADGTISGVA